MHPDLRHALRLFRLQPLWTCTIVATLALGLGVNISIFQLVHEILWRPLDLPQPARLVRVHQTLETLRTSPNPRLQRLWNRLPVAYLDAIDWRAESRTLERIGLYEEGTRTFLGALEPEELAVVEADPELFASLGVEPILGRRFEAGDLARQERVALLGHSLWQRVWGGDPEVLGRAFELDGEAWTVLGVMPAGFEVPGERQESLWLPLDRRERELEDRSERRWRAIARLGDGASLEDARRELAALAAAQAESWPGTNGEVGVRLEPLLESTVGESRPLLRLLMATVAAVLAVACVNVAHLLLARTSQRRGELEIRLALGASRRRLRRQLMSEALVLALTGGLLGLLLAVPVRHGLLAWLPEELPRTGGLFLSVETVAFAAALSCAVALACSWLPATSSSSAAATGSWRTATAPRSALHGGFVVAEIALTLMLSFSAGLLLQSFWRLSAVDPGFRTSGLLVQEIRLPRWSYGSFERRQAFAARALKEARSLPGVAAVAFTSKLPLAGPELVAGFRLPGVDPEDGEWIQGRSASMKFVSPGFFTTLGVPIWSGRGFTEVDVPPGGRVVVLNESLAGGTWPGDDPVGRSFVMDLESGERSYRVVGVARDILHQGVASETGVLMYQPWSQLVDFPGLILPIHLLLVYEGEAAPLAAALRQRLRRLDPALPLAGPRTIDALMSDALEAPRSRARLVLVLAGLAFGLALLGIWAVMSFTVSRRLREIGIRMALGADTGHVRRLVLRRTAVWTALGLALGITGALGGARLLEGLLWGVDARDPWTLAAASALLAAAALAVGLGPARRAGRVDPVRVLQEP